MSTQRLAVHYQGVYLVTFWMWWVEGYLDGQLVIPRRVPSSSFDGEISVAAGTHSFELVFVNRVFRRETRRATAVNVAAQPNQILDVRLSAAWGAWSHPRVQVLGN